MTDRPYDVVVVGAGVVGCAIARTLARHPLRIALVDAAADVGCGTSKANTAILHTGFDATPATLESRLVARGYALLGEYAACTAIPVERTGALLVAWNDDELAAFASIRVKAELNGYTETRAVGPDELRAREPHLGFGALGALEIPGESIVCPWTTTLAYAIEAVSRGVELHLDTRVDDIANAGGRHALQTSRGQLATRWLVNAAGLNADELDRKLGHEAFIVKPRRGELIVFDKLARQLVNHILLPVPTARGKGVLVAPTVFGNVLLGPTADDVGDKTATESTAPGLAFLREKGRAIVPALLDEEVTAIYAGLRAATDESDYRIRAEPAQRYVCVGGIRSTGLTASLAIAEHVVELLADAGLVLGTAIETELPVMPSIGEASARPHQRADLIAADPEYGRIVCHCERVSRGEIRDAFASPLPPRTLEGLRRRTRVQMGRCQGFYCAAEVRSLLREKV